MDDNWAQSIQQTSDGGFIIAGGTYDTTTARMDMLLVKTDPLGFVGVVNQDETKNILSIYPNPFFEQSILHSDISLQNASLTAYNLQGQVVKQIKNIYGQTVTLSRDNLTSGLYFVRLTEESKTIAVDKLVITDK